MKLRRTVLPWSDAPVNTTGDIAGYLREKLTAEQRDYLPESITIYADCEIEQQQIDDFVGEMIRHFGSELPARRARRNRFVDLGLFGSAQIDAFLTARRDLQPWVLYYSRNGGLCTPVLNPDETDENFGVVPCATMQNHGLAWRRQGSNGSFQLWLVTARKEGEKWDWDSDIGHESAHAAFAQIPLYVQPNDRTAPLYDLAAVRDVSGLTAYHLSRMSYMYTEMAVIAVRGESRHTETRLPLTERADELYAFLKLSHTLMPTFGFDRALAAYERTQGVLDFESGTEIFEIGAPAIRVVPHLSRRIGRTDVPTADWFKSLERDSISGRSALN